MDKHMNHTVWNARQEELFTARAKDYEQLEWVRKQEFLNFMVDFSDLQADWNVLDVGTGPGAVAAAVLPHVAEVTGIDLTPEMVVKAQEKHAGTQGLSFVEGDVQELDFPDGVFDLATGRMVFHHVEDCLQGLQEIYRVLKKGGVCSVCEGVPPDHLTRERFEQIFALKEDRHTFSEAELINLFDEAGYDDITVKPVFMRQVSLNNWLENSALPEENIREIRRLHLEADDHFKHVYRLREADGDVFMDWKFIFIKGFKNGRR